tara:strand:- start:185834 stop:186241 length:408 start_codon:yes stop_codon:yes gene_type:complete
MISNIDLSKFKEVFITLGYTQTKSAGRSCFNKGDLSFVFIEQRWEGYELYVFYKEHKIRLDWTLEVYLNKTRVDHIANNIGEKTLDELNNYYLELIFISGEFIVNQKHEVLKHFISWHSRMSESLYKEYLSLLKR